MFGESLHEFGYVVFVSVLLVVGFQTHSAEALCAFGVQTTEIFDGSDVVFVGRVQSINPLPPGTHWDPPRSGTGRRRFPATAAIVFEVMEIQKADHEDLAAEPRLVAGYVNVDYYPDAHDIFHIGEVWLINAHRLGRNLYFVVRCGHSHRVGQEPPPPRAGCGGRCSAGTGSSSPFGIMIVLLFWGYRRSKAQ